MSPASLDAICVHPVDPFDERSMRNEVSSDELSAHVRSICVLDTAVATRFDGAAGTGEGLTEIFTPAEVAVSVYAELISTRAPLPAPAPVVLAAEAVDPVCGMTVAVSEAALSLVDNELTVYFCGPGCRQAYLDSPADFTAVTEPAQLDGCDVLLVTAWWPSQSDWYARDRLVIAEAERRFNHRLVVGTADPTLVLSNRPITPPA